MVAYRLQEMVDESDLSLQELDELINSSLTPEGWTVCVSNLDSAGWDILASMATKLRADGALIRARPIYTACTIRRFETARKESCQRKDAAS